MKPQARSGRNDERKGRSLDTYCFKSSEASFGGKMIVELMERSGGRAAIF